MTISRTNLITEIAEQTGFSKTDTKTFLDQFEETVVGYVSEGENVSLSGFVKFARKSTPAKPARDGRNPATGETIRLAPKPASVKVAVTPLKAFKDTVIEAATPVKKKSKKK